MLRQKIDWEKVPWLMTKVKVSEEYYVNYWRHRPFQREWEGEGKPERERKKGLQSRCHQDTGPQAPIPCHLSSAQTSSPHFLFGLHDVTKEEKNLSTLHECSPKAGFEQQCLKWGSKTGTLRQPRCSKRIPSVTWCQSRIQTGRARLFLSVGSPLHTPGLTHAHPCTDLPLLLLCPGRFLIQAVPTPICWTEKEGTDRSHLCQALLTNDTATHTPSMART